MASPPITRRTHAEAVARAPTEIREARPPLLAWLWAAVFSLLALAGFAYAAARVEVPPSEAFLEFNRPRIHAFAAAAGHELRVVMLGNSRLKYATLPEVELAELAARSGHGRFRFLRLVNDWAVAADFEQLTDEILAARPDLLILQLELLAEERALPGRILVLREYAEWLLRGHEPWDPGTKDQRDLQYDTPCTSNHSPRAPEWRDRRAGRWLRTDPNGPSSRLARELVARAVGQGTRVALLVIPKTEAMEARRSSAGPEFLASAGHLIDLHPGIMLLDAPPSMPDHLYCDVSHMNEDARGSYSGWLVGQLARLLDGSGTSSSARARDAFSIMASS